MNRSDAGLADEVGMTVNELDDTIRALILMSRDASQFVLRLINLRDIKKMRDKTSAMESELEVGKNELRR